MAILAGVPAIVVYHDSRTWELSSFFEIPSISSRMMKGKDLYELYLGCDYTRFNKTYDEKFKRFEKFMVDCKLVKNLNHVKAQDEKNYLSEKFRDGINRKYLNKILNSVYYKINFYRCAINFIENSKYKILEMRGL